MSQTCSTEQGKNKCGSCSGHHGAMLMLGFLGLAVIGALAAAFLG